MALTSKLDERMTIRIRDKASDQIDFNEKYPEVYASQMDIQINKKLEKQNIQLKKRLLPLEIAATDSKEVNKWRTDAALEALEKKQELKRRAIEQTYLRGVAKNKPEAKSNRDHSIAKLDKQVIDLKNTLAQKYPLDSKIAIDPVAVERYQTAEREEEKKLQDLKLQLEENKNKKLAKIQEKVEAKNKNLRKKYASANKKLHDAPKVDRTAFGDGTILRIQNVKMYFGSVKAVDDVSFDIKEGEIFGLIGPNGAGKSTLFNCVTQFYKPTAGNVYFRDKYDNLIDLTEYKTHEIIKVGIARTFQNLELIFGLTVMENLLVGAHSLYRANLFDQFLHTKKLKNEDAINKKLALEILERLGLSAYKNYRPENLSYGNLKKVELARTLMTRPRMIILDEPAAGLNDAETEELTEMIRKIRDDFKCTIFLVEHDMNLVMNVCDTVCATSFGKLLAKGTPDEIQANPDVQEAYLGGKEEEE